MACPCAIRHSRRSAGVQMLDLLGSAHVQTKECTVCLLAIVPHPVWTKIEMVARKGRNAKTAPRATHTAVGNNVDFPLPAYPATRTAQRRIAIRSTFSFEICTYAGIEVKNHIPYHIANANGWAITRSIFEYSRMTTENAPMKAHAPCSAWRLAWKLDIGGSHSGTADRVDLIFHCHCR